MGCVGCEVVEFFFVRHGESVHNADGLFCGQIDSPLTDSGSRQAFEVAQVLADEQLDWIVTSPLIRAHDTALALARARDLPVEVDGRLTEHAKGVLEGTPYRRMRSTEWADVVGAESMRALYERVAQALGDLVGRPGVGVVVAHAGVSRAVECVRVGGDPDRLYELAKVDNATPYRVRLEWLT